MSISMDQVPTELLKEHNVIHNWKNPDMGQK